jgi:hypothetical protein
VVILTDRSRFHILSFSSESSFNDEAGSINIGLRLDALHLHPTAAIIDPLM